MITTTFREDNGKLYLSFDKEVSSDGKLLKNLVEDFNKENIGFSSMSIQGRINRVTFEIVQNGRDLITVLKYRI